MHPDSKRIISQILAPTGTEAVPALAAGVPIPFERILAPRPPQADSYDGPERRAQGVLIAEITGPVPEQMI